MLAHRSTQKVQYIALEYQFSDKLGLVLSTIDENLGSRLIGTLTEVGLGQRWESKGHDNNEYSQIFTRSRA